MILNLKKHLVKILLISGTIGILSIGMKATVTPAYSFPTCRLCLLDYNNCMNVANMLPEGDNQQWEWDLCMQSAVDCYSDWCAEAPPE